MGSALHSTHGRPLNDEACDKFIINESSFPRQYRYAY